MTNESRVRRLLSLVHFFRVGDGWKIHDVFSHRRLRDELKTRRSGYSIVDIDNYARDDDTELLVETGFMDEAHAEARRDVLTYERKLGSGSARYLTVRPAWKKLAVFEGY